MSSIGCGLLLKKEQAPSFTVRTESVVESTEHCSQLSAQFWSSHGEHTMCYTWRADLEISIRSSNRSSESRAEHWRAVVAAVVVVRVWRAAVSMGSSESSSSSKG